MPLPTTDDDIINEAWNGTAQQQVAAPTVSDDALIQNAWNQVNAPPPLPTPGPVQSAVDTAAKMVEAPFTYAGRLVGAPIQDIAQSVSSDIPGQEYRNFQNTGAALIGEETPASEAIKGVDDFWPKLAADVSTGVSGTIPKTFGFGAAKAGLESLGMATKAAEALAGASLFGSTKEGFSIPAGITGAILPTASRLGESMAQKAIGSLGLTSAFNQEGLKWLGRIAGSQAAIDTPKIPEYVNASPDERLKMLAQSIAFNLAFHLAELPGVIGSMGKQGSSETPWVGASEGKPLGQGPTETPSGKDYEQLRKEAIAEARKNGPSPEFKVLFGGLDPEVVGTTPEKVAAYARTFGLNWKPVAREPSPQPSVQPTSAAPATPTQPEQQTGEPNATITRQEERGSEHQGIALGQNVPAYPQEVRKIEGTEAVNSDSVVGGPQVGQSPPPVEAPQQNVARTSIQQVPEPTSFESIQQLLDFRNARMFEERSLFKEQIGLSDEESQKLQSVLQRDGDVDKFASKLSPEKSKKLEWFFEESPFNKRVNSIWKSWEFNKKYNPEEIQHEDDKDFLFRSLITATEHLEHAINSDQFLFAAIASKRLKDLGANQEDFVRALDKYSTSVSGSQGDKVFMFKRAGDRTLNFLKSQGIELSGKNEKRTYPSQHVIPTPTPPALSPIPAPSLPPEPAHPLNVSGVSVRRVPSDQIAIRPDLMQFKRMNNTENGTNEAEQIFGKWDDYKGDNLLLWQPINPAEYGLTGNEQYIISNGHHRLAFGRKQGVPDYNTQILREADGYSADDARRLGAEINISGGKGTIYEAVKFLRNERTAYGEDAAVARARAIGVKGRQATTIAFSAAPDTLDAFVNEIITPDQAEIISETAPNNGEAQRIGIKAALKGEPSDYVRNLMLDAIRSTGGKATELDLFGSNDDALKQADSRARAATGIQRDLAEDIRAISGAVNRPERAAKYGVTMKNPAAKAKKLAELKMELERWKRWTMHPEMVAKVDESLKSKEAEKPQLTLEPPESVEQQKARETAEAKSKADVLAKQKMADEVVKRLTGNAGNMGQGDLLNPPDDLFAPPKPNNTPPEGQPRVSDTSPNRELVESTATGLEPIRAALATSGMTEHEIDAAMRILNSPVIKQLDLSRLTLQIHNLDSRVAGSFQTGPLGSLIRLTKAANAETFGHEMAHFIYLVLPPEMRDQLEAFRQAALKAHFGDNVPEEFRDGTMTTQQFLDEGYNRDLYHLSSPSEFMAAFFGKKIAGEVPTNPEQAGLFNRFVAKIREWARAIINAIRRGLRGRPDMEDFFRKVMSGDWEPTIESGKKYEDEIQGQLARNPKEYDETIKNEDRLNPDEIRDLNLTAQAQNSFVELPGVKQTLGGLSPGAAARLESIFGERQKVSFYSKDKAGDLGVKSVADVEALPIPENIKMLIYGDMAANAVDAEVGMLAKTAKLENEQVFLKDRLGSLTEQKSVLMQQAESFEHMARESALKAENALSAKSAAEETQARADERAAILGMFRKLHGSPAAFSRLYQAMAEELGKTDILDSKDVTATELVDAFRRGRTFDQIADELPANFKVSPETVRIGLNILYHENQLAENLNAIRNSDTEQTRSVIARFRKIAKQSGKEARAELRSVGRNLEALRGTNLALRKINPQIKRTFQRMLDGQEALEAMEKIQSNPEWRSQRNQLYDIMDVRPVIKKVLGNNSELHFRNPITGESVAIPNDTSMATHAEYRSKISGLIEAAKAYLADPDAPEYDPKVARAWRHHLENWSNQILNPDLDPSFPREKPFKFGLPGWLVHPLAVVNNSAGGLIAGRNVILDINALSEVENPLQSVETMYGRRMDLANRQAALAHDMTLEEWYRKVFTRLAGSHQTIGGMSLRQGDAIGNGEVILKQDMEALQAQVDANHAIYKVAHGGLGQIPITSEPSRTKEQGLVRKAHPTSREGYTLNAIMGRQVAAWRNEWNRLKTKESREAWLNQNPNFENVLIGHMLKTATPKYKWSSPFNSEYRKMASEWNHDSVDKPENLEDVALQILDSKLSGDLQTPWDSTDVIKERILSEVSKIFESVTNAEALKEQEARSEVSIYSEDNSFSKPRQEQSTVPDSFMDYGMMDKQARMALMNDAKAFYVIKLVGKNGSLDVLLGALRNRLSEIARSVGASEPSAMSSAQKSKAQKLSAKQKALGQDYYDYNEVKDAIRRLTYVQADIKRVYTNETSKWTVGPEKAITDMYRFIGATVLAQPIARTTHTLGNIMGWAKFYYQLGRHLIPSLGKHVWNIAAGMVKDAMVVIPQMRDAFKSKSERDEMAGLTSSIAQIIMERLEEKNNNKMLGILSPSDSSMAMRMWLQDVRELLNRNTKESRTVKLAKIGPRFLRVVGEVLMDIPRYNDVILQMMSSNVASDMEQRLGDRADKAYGNRKELANGRDYTDLTKPENVLTPAEIMAGGALGKITGQTSVDAQVLRGMFSQQGMNLDAIMLRYHLELAKARNEGRSTDDVHFLTPGERASLKFEIAQRTGTGSLGTRITGARGGFLRQMTGYLHQLPMWQINNFLDAMTRKTALSKSQNSILILSFLLAMTITAVILGVARQSSSALINRALYNQAGKLPTIGQAKTAGEVAKTLTRALASWFPVVDDLVNFALLNTPDNMGHLDSMYFGFNVFKDVLKTSFETLKTWSIEPAIQFLSRYVPLSKAVINRLEERTGSQGIHNAVNDIASATPPGMEQKSRVFGGEYQTTTVTPMIREMVNAAGNDNQLAFEDAYRRAVDEKLKIKGLTRDSATPADVRSAELAVKESFQARNPWLQNLKSLPTESERQEFLDRMSPEQKAEVLAAESAFTKYSSFLGGSTPFTVEQRLGRKLIGSGSSGGGGSPDFGGSRASNRGAGVSGLFRQQVSRTGLRSSGGGGRLKSAGRALSRGGALTRSHVNRLSGGASHFKVAKTHGLKHKKKYV